MAIKVRGWFGTVLVVLEKVLVVWSGLGDFDWSRWSEVMGDGSDGLELLR